MKFSSSTQRLENLGGAKWEVHFEGRKMLDAGADVIEMTIGEPDVPFPDELVDEAVRSLKSGRTNYANGQGEPNLREALASYYSARVGRNIGPENILCLPGAQTALFNTIMGIAEAGDEILVGDPMYATYEAVVRASGAKMVPVPLLPEHNFRIQPDDIRQRITERSRAIFLNTPHNPTGSVLTYDEIVEIGEIAKEHDLWIISDEVYAELVFDGSIFCSPLEIEDLKDRVVVVSSISKSHAAPGLRSGWCVGSQEFVNAVLPVTEAMLFGNQPFIADVTTLAIKNGSPVAKGMTKRFAARAERAKAALSGNILQLNTPQAGMFILVDVTATGKNGDEFAKGLLEQEGVSVMPGSSFGRNFGNWIRLCLTVNDDQFDEAMIRIARYANTQ